MTLDAGFNSELVDWLLNVIAETPDRAGDVFQAILKLELWREAAPKIRALGQPSFDVALAFQSHWLTSGHTIREQINCDSETVRLLRHAMPPYEGKGKTLYRGERKWNWDHGQIGFCWSEKRDVAEMFAGGIHNSEFGAVILVGVFPAAAIIAGPERKQTHTIRDQEREFTIDPFCDIEVEVIDCHGPYDETGNHKPKWPLPEVRRRRCQRC